VIPRNHAPGMDDAEPYLPATDMPRFIRDMMEFVELTERDVVAIRSSAPVVLRHAEALTAALYEKFLALPCSARFFLREDGRSGASTAWPGGYARPGKPPSRRSFPITCSTWASPTATAPTARAGRFLHT